MDESPQTDKSNEITKLLHDWKQGSELAIAELLPLVECELRRIAHAQLRRERNNHTLQTTALINEAYFKLVKADGIEWQSRAHFFGISAKIMRRILINYARDAKAGKRGGEIEHVNIDETTAFSQQRAQELIDLDEALIKLASLNKIKSQIVEMRYFSGMSIEETAEALGISPSSVSQHWRMARAWLRNELGVLDNKI